LRYALVWHCEAMKFLTGDDTGILKQVKVESQKVERFGPQRQGDAVERLCWAGPAEDRESRVAVAFASGLLETRDASTGKVLSSARAAATVKCMQVLGSGLLTVSADGHGGIVKEWCSEACPEGGENGGELPAYAGAPALAGEKGTGEGPWLRQFMLQGPIADACVDPCRADRLAFGGGESDVKTFDLEKGEVSWRAKNVRENSLCLRVPVRVNSLSWATEMAPSRSLLLCGTSDGKIRLYDVNTQRRPLFELLIGHGTGAGSAGYTGTTDDTVRPVNCAKVAHCARRQGGSVEDTRGSAWSIFLGDTVGTLREYDLRYLPTCKAADVPPGRKSHLVHARKQLPYRRGYKGIMGSIRALDIHASGETMVAVGLGRFAYIFETRKRSTASMVGKVYLKQKLCSVLMSSEASAVAKEAEDDDAESDATGGAEPVDGPDHDEFQEGFSDDEDDGDGSGADAGEAAEPAQPLLKGRKKRRRKAVVAVEAGGAADGEDDPPAAGASKKKKRRAAAA